MNLKPKLLIAAYFAFVLGFCFIKYLDYRSDFAHIQPYMHTSVLPATEPITTETIPETTESIETKSTTFLSSTSPAGSTIPPTSEAVQSVTFPLDLNTASVEELTNIPGIGEVTAEAIVAYRTAHGGFLNLSQLMEVEGIGTARYQKLLSFLYLEQEFPVTEPEAITEPEAVTKPEVVTEPETVIETIPVPESVPETDPPVIPIINLNTATKEQLMLLPNCTEELADNILYLRDELIHIIHNPLEITMAEGVTDELYLSWEPYLAVDDEGGTQIPIHGWLETSE